MLCGAIRGADFQRRAKVEGMKVWVVIVPDNELLGVFSSEAAAKKAIADACAANEYYSAWDLEPDDAELDMPDTQ
jgi:hypothetical protein